MSKNGLRMDELGKLVGLLARYHGELIHDAHVGASMEEDPHDTDQREIAINKVEDCLDVISDDFFCRIGSMPI